MIDLRSDTVTKPCDNMRAAMAGAEVGDDIYGGDPTVNRLQDMAAEMLGKEAALFVPSGTQANLIALLCHCQRGDEYIVGQQAHTYKYEGGGAAVLGSIQPQPIELEVDGTLDLKKVRAVIKPYDQHFAKTKLLSLENTIGGKIVPLDYLVKAGEFCEEHNLLMHLDGARLFNAAVGSGIDAAEYAKPFDTVSICLSKGLGAPMGSLLLGSKDLIERAKHWRKMLGGGMRQIGIIAAAGIYALENNITTLANDHENAQLLCDMLLKNPSLNAAVQTCMVFIDVPEGEAEALVNFLEARGIKAFGGKRMRLVIHRDIHRDDIETIASAIDNYFETK